MLLSPMYVPRAPTPSHHPPSPHVLPWLMTHLGNPGIVLISTFGILNMKYTAQTLIVCLSWYLFLILRMQMKPISPAINKVIVK